MTPEHLAVLCSADDKGFMTVEQSTIKLVVDMYKFDLVEPRLVEHGAGYVLASERSAKLTADGMAVRERLNLAFGWPDPSPSTVSEEGRYFPGPPSA